jgi:hypothetical protein
MPARGKTKVSDAQRRKIAAGKLAGKPHSTIAAETGLAVSTVDHQLADQRTTTLILLLKNRDRAQLERMWKKGLDGLEKDLTAKDRAVAAMARGQLFRLLPLGDPPLLQIAATDSSGGHFTLEQLLESYRKVTVHGSGNANTV